MLASRLDRSIATATRELLTRQCSQGYWEGRLSSSALSTATAVTALEIAGRPASAHTTHIHAGLEWLATHSNDDGGWGDTVSSVSNLSTTTLCWAAFTMLRLEKHHPVLARAEEWLTRRVGSMEPKALASAIIRLYGKDRTFSVPILTHCALAGCLGSGPNAWRPVIPLPFELAACPHSWFAALRLPVVSYALPALISIGQARHHHSPSANPVVRFVRNMTRARTLRVLKSIQPSNGGFLEATPLTSFVVMSLAGSGQADHPVTAAGVEFLLQSARADGSWPIDTNLATWVTTLSVNALGGAKDQNLDPDGSLVEWLLNQQYQEEHPYTHAAPGGWAWTDLPGGVPDADDTSGAILALHRLARNDPRVGKAVHAGLDWLINLQNRDGGIPTFCRGWGALPFDRSSPDITAHALRACSTWYDAVSPSMAARIQRATKRAIGFLSSTQGSDGSWTPLWFGNQFANDDANPTYGTSRVVLAMGELSVGRDRLRLDPGAVRSLDRSMELGVASLLRCQNADGSWGGGPHIEGSIEETALALEALASPRAQLPDSLKAALGQAIRQGSEWLCARVDDGTWKKPAPIGFYFAKLWYFEELYPLLFTVGALRTVNRWLATDGKV